MESREGLSGLLWSQPGTDALRVAVHEAAYFPWSVSVHFFRNSHH